MNESAKLKFVDLKRIVGEHLKTALNISDFSITYAKQEDDDWKVNVEFTEGIPPIVMFKQSALFRIDGTTGEVKEFKKGSSWQF